jgi:hypothetical protein
VRDGLQAEITQAEAHQVGTLHEKQVSTVQALVRLLAGNHDRQQGEQ